MNHIKSYYSDYTQLFEDFGEEKIQKRYEFLLTEIDSFIERIGAKEKLVTNERVLMHAVLEYFEDISKLKVAHDLQHANDPKVIAYTAYWLLRRKPIQLFAVEDEDESLVFANEKFVLSFLVQFITFEQEARPLAGDNLAVFKGFIDSLYYYLKFRKLDAQSLELILMAFRTGKIFS